MVWTRQVDVDRPGRASLGPRHVFAREETAFLYAKALLPDPGIPFLLITSREHAVLIPQLRAHGWTIFGGAAHRSDAAGVITVTPDGLRLVIDGQQLLEDDANPVAPEGWWPAVDRHRGRCWVVVVPDGQVDLSHASSTGQQLLALIGRRNAVCGLLPVRA